MITTASCASDVFSNRIYIQPEAKAIPAYSSFWNTSGIRLQNISRSTPPNTPVITAAMAAMMEACPLSSATWAPIMENTTKPSASSTRNTLRRCVISGATKVVTTAAAATIMMYSGFLTQLSG